KRSGARDMSSSTARIPAIPLPTTTSRGRRKGSPLMGVSDARLRETRRTHYEKALAQIIPPRERYAGHVEGKEDLQCQMRSASRCDGGPKTARDQAAAAGADCSAESQ